MTNQPATVRVALFNVRELSLEKIEEEGAGNEQLLAAARIVARIQPDVLVVQEIDWIEGDDSKAAMLLRDRYLVPAGAPAYEHVFSAPSNTGALSGIDLNGDGHVATDADRGERQHGDDSYGFGVYPGQYSMAVLSRFPLDSAAARSFQKFLWRDMPDHLMPPGFYSQEAEAIFRLSSKSHWDLPVRIGDRDLHLLVSHPTPPVFDGDEDRNGRRNFDEIRLWAEYLNGAEWLVDDSGRSGGLDDQAAFVILGDLNARPNATESLYGGRTAISQLLEHPRVFESGDFATSAGGLAGRQAGPPDFRERATAGFGEGSRIDYVLPSRNVSIEDGGVYWPAETDDPQGAADAELASDHRLVWLDLALPGS